MNHARTTEQGAKREQLGVKQVMIGSRKIVLSQVGALMDANFTIC